VAGLVVYGNATRWMVIPPLGVLAFQQSDTPSVT
jgi:hypothetical protein